MILTLWLIFIFWAFKYYRPTKPKHKAPPGLTVAQIERQRKQAEKDLIAAEKQHRQQEQALADIGHYSEQLNALYTMQRDTMHLLDTAQQEVDTDTALNKFGAVIPVKIASKHIRERDRYQKALLTLNNQIHTAEKKRTAAQQIIDSAGKT